MRRILPWVGGALVAVALGIAAQQVAHAVAYNKGDAELAAMLSPAPPAPGQCNTVTLNGSVETIFTGLSGRCYRVSTNGRDIYYFVEPTTAWDAGVADATQSRLPDPGVEKACLQTGQTKLHFFASAATTATVCQTGP